MKGYSIDNYIIDQDYFGNYLYRSCPANFNGCGPIAVYNLLKYHGIEKSIGEIINEMNNLYLFNIPGPTTMKILRKYLSTCFSDICEFHGKDNCLLQLKSLDNGIFRYNEESVPHLVFFYRTDADHFRFFNVNDNFEDCILSTDQFASRLLPGYTVLITAS